MQRRAGALDDAQATGRIVSGELTAGAARFVSRQRFAVASSLQRDGAVWVSLVTGRAGFIAAVDRQLIALRTQPRAGDPLAGDLAARPELGLLVLDPRTRQRMRFNGSGLLSPDGIFLLVAQAYGNCPKYIQRRRLEPDAPSSAAGTTSVTPALGDRARAMIAAADTLFIGSFHPAGGADASHRGGFPGFVRVLGPTRLAFDDYPGNSMFNTLGNLVAYPQAGLLFVDFTTGDLVQITGRADVQPDFSVIFDVNEVRETPDGSPLRFSLEEFSPANPPLSRAAPSGISRAEEARTR